MYFSTTLTHSPLDAERSWNSDARITPYGYIEPITEIQSPRHSLTQRVLANGYPDKENALWLDDAITAIWDTLDQKDLLENTVIVFASDHGMEAKGTVYDGGTYTPAFVWWPDEFLAGELDIKLQNIDIFPTLIELVTGRDYSEVVSGLVDEFSGIDGISFKDQLVVPDLVKQNREYFYHELGYTRSVSDGALKYVAFRRDETQIGNGDLSEYYHFSVRRGGVVALEQQQAAKFPHYFDSDQLYDLEIDPDSQVNFVDHPAYQGDLQRLKSKLAEFVEKFDHDFAEFTDMDF